jgi:hypothetical protein
VLTPRWEGVHLPAPAPGSGPPVDAWAGESDGRGGGVVEGKWTDQALPEGGFRARWGRAPARLAMGERDDEFLGAGWYPPEDWPPKVRWTAARAVAYLTQDEWMTSVGITMCRPQHDSQPTTGQLRVNGRVVGRFEAANPALEPFTFPLEPVDAAQEVEVAVEIAIPIQPAAAGASDDRRVLGVAVHELWLE